jgi:LacI family transcriptional regulator
MKRKVTLKIAKELDVSISTVSKSLEIVQKSERYPPKVQAFAKFYNYRPNNIA